MFLSVTSLSDWPIKLKRSKKILKKAILKKVSIRLSSPASLLSYLHTCTPHKHTLNTYSHTHRYTGRQASVRQAQIHASTIPNCGFWFDSLHIHIEGPFLCKFAALLHPLTLSFTAPPTLATGQILKAAEETLILLNTNDDTARQRGLSHGLLCHARPLPWRHVVVRLATLEPAKPLRDARHTEHIKTQQHCFEMMSWLAQT